MLWVYNHYKLFTKVGPRAARISGRGFYGSG